VPSWNHALGERVSRAATAERLIAQLTRVFSALALILAAVGLYGTLSYACREHG